MNYGNNKSGAARWNSSPDAFTIMVVLPKGKNVAIWLWKIYARVKFKPQPLINGKITSFLDTWACKQIIVLTC